MASAFAGLWPGLGRGCLVGEGQRAASCPLGRSYRIRGHTQPEMGPNGPDDNVSQLKAVRKTPRRRRPGRSRQSNGDATRSKESHRSAFFRLLLQDRAREAFRLVADGAFTPTSADLNDVLTMLSRRRKIKAAVKTIREATDEWKLLPPTTVKSASILIDIYGKAKMLPEAMHTFEEMQRNGVEPNIVTFNSLLSAAARTDNPALAFSLFKTMESRGVVPDKFTYGSLIDGCSKAGLVDRAIVLAKQMSDVGIPKDQTTYATIMDACGRSGHLRKLFLVFEEMKQAGSWPNLIIFAILIDACANALQPERALEIFREIKHWDLEPNVVIYTSLIDACSKGGLPERGVAAYEEMLQDGIAPNEKTFGALLDGWVRAGNYEEAFGVLRLMRENGVPINGVLALGLLQISQYAKRVEGAVLVWDELMAANVRPFRSLYILMLNTLTEAEEADRALDTAEDALRRGLLSPCDKEMKATIAHVQGLVTDGEDERNKARINSIMSRFADSI